MRGGVAQGEAATGGTVRRQAADMRAAAAGVATAVGPIIGAFLSNIHWANAGALAVLFVAALAAGGLI